MYFFAGTEGTAYLYHNTFATQTGLVIGSTTPERGDPNTWYINNTFSNEKYYRLDARFPFDAHAHSNYIAGEDERYEWVAKENFRAPGKRLWATESPDFLLEVNSPARNRGLDLSKEVTLDGKTFGPLPGMTPGYFKGAMPHLGAVRFGSRPGTNLPGSAIESQP